MSERQIDDAIDAAVRDLMNVDTDPAFRARVVERLRQPTPHGSWWRQITVAAAALVVVVAVVLMRGGKEPVTHEPAATTAASITTPPQTASRPDVPQLPASTAPAPRPIVRRNAATTTTHAIERGTIVATVADVDSASADAMVVGTVEPQGPIATIDLTPIVHTPITTPAVSITPLESPGEIVIAPLDPRRDRN